MWWAKSITNGLNGFLTCYFLITQLIFRGGMQGQPLNTRYKRNNDS